MFFKSRAISKCYNSIFILTRLINTRNINYVLALGVIVGVLFVF